ncbi:hypothetical protein TNCV_595691 [Trichonephila clavipes]|nr:hypothetical protein TNCV_595691 [Trichonephila clavipes]
MWPPYPISPGHELMVHVVESRVVVLGPLKAYHAERLMHVKSVESQNHHIGVVFSHFQTISRDSIEKGNRSPDVYLFFLIEARGVSGMCRKTVKSVAVSRTFSHPQVQNSHENAPKNYFSKPSPLYFFPL